MKDTTKHIYLTKIISGINKNWQTITKTKNIDDGWSIHHKDIMLDVDEFINAVYVIYLRRQLCQTVQVPQHSVSLTP